MSLYFLQERYFGRDLYAQTTRVILTYLLNLLTYFPQERFLGRDLYALESASNEESNEESAEVAHRRLTYPLRTLPCDGVRCTVPPPRACGTLRGEAPRKAHAFPMSMRTWHEHMACTHGMRTWYALMGVSHPAWHT